MAFPQFLLMPLEDLLFHNVPGWILFISSLRTGAPGSSPVSAECCRRGFGDSQVEAGETEQQLIALAAVAENQFGF